VRAGQHSVLLIGSAGSPVKTYLLSMSYKMGGWRPLLLKGERDWLLARIAEKPDLTLRAVVVELAARGTPASYGAVWRFFASEGITFKKKPVRQRTGSRRRRPAAGPLEDAPEPA
jgi:transposase